MSRRRIRSPLASFSLFLIVCGMGWVAWENREFFQPESEEIVLDLDLRDRVQEAVYDELNDDTCFFDLRGMLNWRPNERRYRLDLLIEEGETCERRAREICVRAAGIIQRETGVVATVVAFDSAGRELGRCVL